MKPKQNTLGTVFVIVGIVMVVLCLILVWNNVQEDKTAGEAITYHLYMMQNAIEEKALEAIAQAPLEAEPEKTAETVADETEPLQENSLPVMKIDGYDYIGYLTFPTLGLELPVMDRWDEERLKIAPCLYYGSPETEDLVIAGHNYRSIFGRLTNLRIGDAVSFTDMNGEVHEYIVEDTEVLNPTAVLEMVSSGWNLSLYTCNYDGTQRYTVRCMEVKP